MGFLDLFKTRPAVGEALDRMVELNDDLAKTAKIQELQNDFIGRLSDKWAERLAERDELIKTLLLEREGGPLVDPALIRDAKIALGVATVGEAYDEFKKAVD